MQKNNSNYKTNMRSHLWHKMILLVPWYPGHKSAQGHRVISIYSEKISYRTNQKDNEIGISLFFMG